MTSNNVYAFIYLTLLKNNKLDKEDDNSKIIKVNIIVYIAELLYRLFYCRNMIDGLYFACPNNIKIQPLDFDMSDLDKIKKDANLLTKEEQQLILPCLKEFIVDKSSAELIEIINTELIAYKETKSSKTGNIIPNDKINYDVGLIKQYFTLRM